MRIRGGDLEGGGARVSARARACSRLSLFLLAPQINVHSFPSRSVESFETARVRRHAERAEETRERNGSELVQRSRLFPAVRARRTIRTSEGGRMSEREGGRGGRGGKEAEEQGWRGGGKRRVGGGAESRGARERRFKGKKEEAAEGKGTRARGERGREGDRERERSTNMVGKEGAWRTGRSLRSSAGNSAATAGAVTSTLRRAVAALHGKASRFASDNGAPRQRPPDCRRRHPSNRLSARIPTPTLGKLPREKSAVQRDALSDPRRCATAYLNCVPDYERRCATSKR